MSAKLENRTYGSILPRQRLLCGILPFVLLILTLVSLCGCFGGEAGLPVRTPSAKDPMLTPAPLTSVGRRTPLALAERSIETDEYAAVFPNVCEDGFELLNIAIRSAVEDFARECVSNNEGTDIDCRVAYNDRGLLSLILSAYRGGAEPMAVGTASFDCDTGGRIFLSDLMGGEGDYRFAFADMVTEKLTVNGRVLISYVPPVDDARLCFFDVRGLVLVYRRYEICDADAGEPYVLLSFDEIKDYLGEEALLKRLPYFDGAE